MAPSKAAKAAAVNSSTAVPTDPETAQPTPKRTTSRVRATNVHAKPAGSTAGAHVLPVRSDETPWTEEELAEIRRELEHDIQRAVADLQTAEEDLQGLIWDAGNGNGDDQADAGAKTYEREQEITLANISRDKLAQNRHALGRLDNGSYGICELCSQPIGKFRLQAAPRATLCRTCKEKTERG
jgi:RNA polymerase-binding transcription factor DksA